MIRALVLVLCACTTSAPPPPTGPLSCRVADKSEFCRACTPIEGVSCTQAKPIEACCAFTNAPRAPLRRGTGLVEHSSEDPVIDLSCLDAPKPIGESQLVTLSGHVRIFSTGDDTAGVKIEIFEIDPLDGSLGNLVGTPATTTPSDAFLTPKPTLLSSCVQGCTYRAFTYAGVPTEKPIAIRTSDASDAGQKWAQLYEYVFFENGAIASGSELTIDFEPTAVTIADRVTLAALAGGFILKADRGLLTGEVRDCAGVRLANAMVGTDVNPEGEPFYFSENEANPLASHSLYGTSSLGKFAGMNYSTARPVRVRAVGSYQGKDVLVGTYTVRVFPGAVTMLSLRGREAWQ